MKRSLSSLITDTNVREFKAVKKKQTKAKKKAPKKVTSARKAKASLKKRASKK